MKLLLSDKEIVEFLFILAGVDMKPIRRLPFGVGHIDAAIDHTCREKNKRGFNLDKKRDKIKAKIRRAVEKDVGFWMKSVTNEVREQKEKKFNYIYKHLNYFIDKLGEENVLNAYLKFNQKSFVKDTGLSIDRTATLIRRKKYTDYNEDCLFRNMAGNEELLLHKMDNNLPFWFIDTGYTNFISGKGKKWHRLTQNHLHHIKEFTAPVDRLNSFEVFPKQWRTGGDKILIIEPGEFSARTFGIDIKKWKKDIVEELRKYTDKKIIIREKLSKKVRKSLYRELCDDDYYCVININSNAAVESIWAGVPAITLHSHITNSVTRNKISDINNLHRPHLANWLCMLSYCQFTYEELISGTAAYMVKTYHV